MGAKKVVLDTNVFVSALGWKGASRDIFEGCIRGDLKLFLSTKQNNFDVIKKMNKKTIIKEMHRRQILNMSLYSLSPCGRGLG